MENTQQAFKLVAIADIDCSPFNYRKGCTQQSLADFATELTIHGIISPLTVRATPNGRYELVAGERRLKAASIAGLTEVPVIQRVLNDEEVIELQLSENLQRENPHPLHEAQAIGRMQQSGRTITEIAARLGKSKTFVYSRSRLLALITPFQEMFLVERITLQQAFDIAAVSAEAQAALFGEHCIGWEKNKRFALNHLQYLLEKFQYDLKEAPFSTKSKTLIPEAGACITCASNTATLKSLFPEYAKQAICNNSHCYEKKCTAHFSMELNETMKAEQPAALLFNGHPSPLITLALQSIAAAAELPQYKQNEVEVVHAPLPPDKNDFSNEWEIEEGEAIQIDEAAYQQAMDTYQQDLEEYQTLLQSGRLLKGLLITDRKLTCLLFHPDKKPAVSGHPQVTAKEVQAAIKNGTATVRLLEAEIARINAKEIRSRELDTEKIQLTIHEQFCAGLGEFNDHLVLTLADTVTARYLVYQSLDYATRHKIDRLLFAEQETASPNPLAHFYDQLNGLTDQQFGYLIRSAVAGKADSKYPNQVMGYCLMKMAAAAGIDVNGIESEQQQKAAVRNKQQQTKIAELRKKIDGLAMVNKPKPETQPDKARTIL